ncbi:MAG: RNA-binding cell elongation regulator Jag/EloR [Dehalococcoidia bacterium]
MESVEVSAKSVDEAIDIALEDLGLKRSQVSIEILTPGKPGIFGLGGEPARVRVTALEEGTARPMEQEDEDEDQGRREDEGPRRTFEHEEEPENIELKDLDSEEVLAAADFLRSLIKGMDIDAEVTIREPETPADGAGRASAVLDIEGEDLGLLIGRRGTTLSAVQYMVNVMLTRKMNSRVLVTVDVEHYHRRREETLRGLAQRMADRVSRSRRPMTLEPMPANERRIIHLALSEDRNVVTGSVGQGEERKVVIRPRGGGQGDGEQRGGRGRYQDR